MSPTVSTVELTGLDDYFIRVCIAEDQPARVLAEYLFRTRGWRRMAAASTVNQAYPENLLKLFTKQFEALGGKVEVVGPVNPSSSLDEVKSARGQPSNPASRLAAALVPLTAN